MSSIHTNNLVIKNTKTANKYIPKKIDVNKTQHYAKKNKLNVSAKSSSSKNKKNIIEQSNVNYTTKSNTVSIPHMTMHGHQQGKYKNTNQNKIVKFNLKPSYVTSNYMGPTMGQQKDLPAPILQ